MQTKFESFIEVNATTAIKFVASVLIQQFIINPMFGLKQPFIANLTIVAIFTVSSIVLGYLLRRFFNSRAVKKAIHDAL